MELFGLLSSFGGGLLGAAIGGTSSFILTGFIAISGAIIALCTGNSDVLNLIAFGSFLGPHIMFQGSVAATAYARRKHMIKNGADINQSLHILESSSILLIGGIFGLFGYLVKYGFEQIITLPIDYIACTVLTMGIITRLLFGKAQIFGDTTSQRDYLPNKKALFYTALLGGGIGICVSGVGLTFMNTGNYGTTINNFPSICFGFSAVSLLLLQIGLQTPVTHHITLPSASAAILTGNLIIGVICGIACAIFQDLFARIMNTKCESHIDPPAATIFLSSLIVQLILLI